VKRPKSRRLWVILAVLVGLILVGRWLNVAAADLFVASELLAPPKSALAAGTAD
jgi:hypothetical protein